MSFQIYKFIRIECDKDYLLPDCFKKYCVPQNDDINGHYNCTEHGEKICLHGWIDAETDCSKITL